MSVGAFAVDSKNKKGKYIPISSEFFYRRVWDVAAKELNLHIFKQVGATGADLTRAMLPELFIELDQLRKWAEASLCEEDQRYMLPRIQMLDSVDTRNMV